MISILQYPVVCHCIFNRVPTEYTLSWAGANRCRDVTINNGSFEFKFDIPNATDINKAPIMMVCGNLN